jgi:hypothetical protein
MLETRAPSKSWREGWPEGRVKPTAPSGDKETPFLPTQKEKKKGDVSTSLFFFPREGKKKKGFP